MSLDEVPPPGAALVEELDKRLLVQLRDGRKIVGILRWESSQTNETDIIGSSTRLIAVCFRTSGVQWRSCSRGMCGSNYRVIDANVLILAQVIRSVCQSCTRRSSGAHHRGNSVC